MSKRCGDYGGLGAEGPCARKAGWGIKGRTVGRCKQHDESADANLQASKETFLEAFAKQPRSFKKAAALAGVDQSTVWRWRQSDDDFDKKCEEAKPIAANVRLSAIEDAVYRAIVTGKAPGSLIMFTMVNLAIQAGRPADWRHIQQIITSGGNTEEALRSWADLVRAVENEEK